MVKITEEAINLIKLGYSLNKIAKLTGLNKTTVYYHFRKIKGRTATPITIQSRDEELIGEFIGLFAGDGCFYKARDYQYRVYLFFNLKEESFVEDLTKKVLVKLFGKQPMKFVVKNKIVLVYYSKEIYKLIKTYIKWDEKDKKTYSVELDTNKHSKRFIIGFIRGCLDSDGHLSKKRITFASVSQGLISNIHYLLNKLRLSHRLRLYKEKRKNRRDIYHIEIKRKDYSRFIGLISPRNKKNALGEI